MLSTAEPPLFDPIPKLYPVDPRRFGEVLHSTRTGEEHGDLDLRNDGLYAAVQKQRLKF